MILFGAGGHGKVILSILADQGKTVAFIVDENPAIKEFMGYKVTHFKDALPGDDEVIIAIGDNRIRYEKYHQLAGKRFCTAVHSSANVDENSRIGAGTVVMPMSVINTSSQLGEQCIINTGSVVEHDCHLGGFVHIAPHATVCGGCTIGDGTLVGAGAVLVPEIRVGKWCIIGAGAVVTRDVPDGATVVGNPAKIKLTNE